MGFKRGTDNVELIKVDAAIDLASTQAITANGEHGTLSFTLAGAWAAVGPSLAVLIKSLGRTTKSKPIL
mgnify:CR=1 FL=1